MEERNGTQHSVKQEVPVTTSPAHRDNNLQFTGESETVAHGPEQGQNPIGLNLNLTGAQSSSSSLLEAVIGPEHAKQVPLTTQRSTSSPLRPAIQARSPQLESDSLSSSRGGSSVSTGSSMERIEKSDKSSSEWEVLSDAASRANSGQKPDAVEVEELQKKVDKRRSNYQILESELAALEAQLKAADERLAQAEHITSGSGPRADPGV